MVMVVIGEVEVHVGPPVEQEKIDQILTNMKNQEKEPNLIKNVLETHSQKMAKMKKGADAWGLKFEELTEIIGKVINDYK